MCIKGKIISKFREKPKTNIAWQAMILGLSTILTGPMLGLSAAVLRPVIDKAFGEFIGILVGFCVMALALFLLVSSLVIGIRAFKKGERSFVLWVGFVPAILNGAFWIFMVIGEFLFSH